MLISESNAGEFKGLREEVENLYGAAKTMTTYKIVDDFQVRRMRVLVLDREYKVGNTKLTIDGEEYRYMLNSVKDWIIIESSKSFKGKTAVFT